MHAPMPVKDPADICGAKQLVCWISCAGCQLEADPTLVNLSNPLPVSFNVDIAPTVLFSPACGVIHEAAYDVGGPLQH